MRCHDAPPLRIADAGLSKSSCLITYTKDLRSISRGSGSYTLEDSGYEQAPYDVQQKLVKEYQEKRAAGN